eukprot:2011118-Pyramimonas_sp.AAC.1
MNGSPPQGQDARMGRRRRTEQAEAGIIFGGVLRGRQGRGEEGEICEGRRTPHKFIPKRFPGKLS